jgi:hypothetical protein
VSVVDLISMTEADRQFEARRLANEQHGPWWAPSAGLARRKHLLNDRTAGILSFDRTIKVQGMQPSYRFSHLHNL